MNPTRHRKAMLTAPLLIVSVVASGCAGSGSGSQGTVGVASGPRPSATTGQPGAAMAPQAEVSRTFAALERSFGAHLGVYVLDTGTGRTVTFNPGERFAYCSTFKALATGILLARDTDAQLGHVIHYSAADLVYYSPVTSRHVSTGMTLRAIMAAAVD